MQLQLANPITKIPLVGPQYAKKLIKLNIKTVGDLLYHFPARYQDFGAVKLISELVAGEPATIKAQVLEIRNIYTKYGKKLTKAKVADQSGHITCWWFNQHYLTQNIKAEKTFYFSGRLGQFGGQVSLVAPEYEPTEKDTQLHTGSMVPIYPETGGVSSKWLRSRISVALKTTAIGEFLPQETLADERLVSLKEALNQIHLPPKKTDFEKAKERLAFDELFVNILKGLYKKELWRRKAAAPEIKPNSNITDRFVITLPFRLTKDQERVIQEILKDLSKPVAMNRLLQGDVGCGKTVVAAAAALATCNAGHNTAFMAPTQILAEQHFRNLKEYLKPFGVGVILVKGGKKPAKLVSNLSNPQTKGTLFVGTHALLFKKDLPNPALVIIDEQHRFGVKQRAKLSKNSHTLTMTATPIPRSLALTLYGDLDISTILEMPKGRQPVTTWLVPNAKRTKAGEWLEKQIKKTNPTTGQAGGQAFWVCPFIEESFVETLQSVKAVTTEFENLKKEFRTLNLGLLHGRLKHKQKETVLDSFRKGKIDILVTTPVVEVGVDIPNAGYIVIEGAERFGLASLHQLRGRVGRGGQKAYCLLFTTHLEFEKSSRLKALEKKHNGLELAQLDLKIRGSGTAFGTAQHGRIAFKLADLSDTKMLTRARAQAQVALSRLPENPALFEKIKEVEKIAAN
ncbi:MAG: ATP-dependent DNA helicase RecG [bacterium]